MINHQTLPSGGGFIFYFIFFEFSTPYIVNLSPGTDVHNYPSCNPICFKCWDNVWLATIFILAMKWGCKISTRRIYFFSFKSMSSWLNFIVENFQSSGRFWIFWKTGWTGKNIYTHAMSTVFKSIIILTIIQPSGITIINEQCICWSSLAIIQAFYSPSRAIFMEKTCLLR